MCHCRQQAPHIFHGGAAPAGSARHQVQYINADIIIFSLSTVSLSRPESAASLVLGSRVCMFWSSKMSFLHPGLVTGLAGPGDPGYVLVSTDDGDQRDVHISQVRHLPPSFSTLDTPAPSTATPGRRRSASRC